MRISRPALSECPDWRVQIIAARAARIAEDSRFERLCGKLLVLGPSFSEIFAWSMKVGAVGQIYRQHCDKLPVFVFELYREASACVIEIGDYLHRAEIPRAEPQRPAFAVIAGGLLLCFHSG